MSAEIPGPSSEEVSNQEFRKFYEEGLGIDATAQEKVESPEQQRGWVPEKHLWARQDWNNASVDTEYFADVRLEGQPVPPKEEIRPHEVLLAPGESVGLRVKSRISEGKDRVLINEDGKPVYKRPKKNMHSRGWLVEPYKDYS